MKPIWLFRTLAVVLVFALGLLAAEWALRHREGGISSSDRLDPGLVIYDELLGWKLNPGWRGNHRHHDYAVSYTISSRGYRGPERPLDVSVRHWLVLGDSFTFGFGVNDGETFVDRLNEAGIMPGDGRNIDRPGQATDASLSGQESSKKWLAFRNLGVPGYSTDQELLLIERELARYKVHGVLLMVYLGNDLLDNPRSTAIQVPLRKPYFEIGDRGLVLRNTPVPRGTSGSGNPQAELRRAVLGDAPVPFLSRLTGASALLRTLGFGEDRMPSGESGFDERLGPALELFARLIQRFESICQENEIELVVALLPGRSYVELPDSISAAYQEHLRSGIVDMAPRFNATFLDLAVELRQAYAENRESFFFPNDGHLTSVGHRKVARLLDLSLWRMDDDQ